MVKYFYNDGLNVITAGAFTYNFEQPKKSCDSEFFMLHRVGMLSFDRIGTFTGDIMENFQCEEMNYNY